MTSEERLRAATPPTVRHCGERRAHHCTRAAITLTTLLITATTLTLRSAPDHYEPPVPPGALVTGIPPKAAQGPLAQEQQRLRALLRSNTDRGPARLAPELR